MMEADLRITESECVDHWVCTISYQGVLRRLAQDAQTQAQKRKRLEITHDLLELARKLGWQDVHESS